MYSLRMTSPSADSSQSTGLSTDGSSSEKLARFFEQILLSLVSVSLLLTGQYSSLIQALLLSSRDSSLLK